jgi:hypothetical protein
MSALRDADARTSSDSIGGWRDAGIFSYLAFAPTSSVGAFVAINQFNFGATKAMAKGGVRLFAVFNGLACPTFANRPIESQWIFLRLSHRFSAASHVRPTADIQAARRKFAECLEARFDRRPTGDIALAPRLQIIRGAGKTCACGIIERPTRVVLIFLGGN